MGIVTSYLSNLMLITGSLFLLIGAIGLIRMPDVFTRMHAASIMETAGASLIIIISITLAISLYRALIGPTLFDRLLAANIIGTTTVLFLVMYGYLTGRTDFLDIAIAYILLNLIGTFAVLKYFRYGTLSHGEED